MSHSGSGGGRDTFGGVVTGAGSDLSGEIPEGSGECEDDYQG